jgi:hypothetical protein
MKLSSGYAMGWLFLLVIGCASTAEPKPAVAPQASSGEEAADEAADEMLEEEASAPSEVPSGPASLTVEVSVQGESKPAAIKVIAADGRELASGKTGERLTLESGEHTLLVAIEDAKVLADRPTKRMPLTLLPGDDVEQKVEVPWASDQLNVRVNGQLERNATVRVLKQGAEVAKVKSNAEHITLSPGRYQAEVKTRGATILVEQVLFPEGATQTVPVDVRM